MHHFMRILSVEHVTIAALAVKYALTDLLQYVSDVSSEQMQWALLCSTAHLHALMHGVICTGTL